MLAYLAISLQVMASVAGRVGLVQSLSLTAKAKQQSYFLDIIAAIKNDGVGLPTPKSVDS